MTMPRHPDAVPPARRLRGVDQRMVLAAVADHFGTTTQRVMEKRNREVSRDLAAWLARELTPVTLWELSTSSGLTHPDSVCNLIRRADRVLSKSPRLRGEIEAIRQIISKTENRI